MKSLTNVVTSMSSLEIAELTGKQHKDVLYDIRKMLDELGVLAADFSATRKVRGREYEVFNLPKRETLILVSGYSVTMRSTIIDRWQELESLHQERLEARTRARLEAPLMTKSLQDLRAREGKESPPHVFVNEHNMIYKIVLGFTASQYRNENGVSPDISLRDILNPEEIKAVECLQRHDITLSELGFGFKQRKAELKKIFMRNHAQPMLEEINRLNA